MKKAIIIFTRVPIPGKTKTRLSPFYTDDECAELHSVFLKDIWKECKKVTDDVFVYYTPEGDEACLFDVLGDDLNYKAQVGKDLGEKMYNAISEVLSAGFEKCILIGSDIPELTSKELSESFLLLEDCDLVFGPSEDKGYYLVGMKSPIKGIFDNQIYGYGTVLDNAVTKAKEEGLNVSFAQMINDIDEPRDIRDLKERMNNDVRLSESHTGQYLRNKRKISVIIPVYNEEKEIDEFIKKLSAIDNFAEVIVVDGGSTDRTVELIQDKIPVFTAPKGRASQMNFGAEISNGDILFFLHSDSVLPNNAKDMILSVMEKSKWGCFGIEFDSKSILMKINGFMSNFRVKSQGIAFGDQGIFIDRHLFYEIGMLPDMPIMEDYQLSMTLKEKGYFPKMTEQRIKTSPRRYPKRAIGKLRVMYEMFKLRHLYRGGTKIEIIAEKYRDIR